MNTRPRTVTLVLSALAALVVAVVLVAWLLIDTERIGERLDAALDDALGMDVQLGEPPRFGLLRGPNVTLEDLELSTQGQLTATAETVWIRFALFSLLSGTVDPVAIHIERLEVVADPVGSGVFDSDDPEQQIAERNRLSLERLRVSDAHLRYGDQGAESARLSGDCDIDLRDIRHDGGALEQALATLAAEGAVNCRSVSRGRFTVRDLSVRVDGRNGLFELEPIRATIFQGQAEGSLEADLSSGTPEFRLKGGISGMDIGAFVAALEADQSAAGEIDFELDLNAGGSNWRAIRQSTGGWFRLGSDELTIDGYDLDEQLDEYAETQRFNLIDVGAVFLAGPIGLAASRGYAFTGLLQGSGGSTTIDRMVSKWRVEAGVAQADDVAFRTAENRLALTGAMDFGESRFEDIRVAVLDGEGCAVVEQRLTGPFTDPEVKKPNFLLTVAGPLLELIERGVATITDSDCEAFYNGSVAQP